MSWGAQERQWEKTESKWERKTFLALDYADDLSILDESVSKIDKLLEVLRVQGARICLKINTKKSFFSTVEISLEEWEDMSANQD